jgi:hydrogenase maturation protein HypF
VVCWLPQERQWKPSSGPNCECAAQAWQATTAGVGLICSSARANPVPAMTNCQAEASASGTTWRSAPTSTCTERTTRPVAARETIEATCWDNASSCTSYMLPAMTSLVRRRYQVRGVVQGVGFRPRVATVAARHQVSGWCGNDDQQVFIEVQGAPAGLDQFWADLLASLPPLAIVLATTNTALPVLAGEQGFNIVASQHEPGLRTLIPPDVATCTDCLAELADPDDRRYRYPFTNCTNCGPRLSIITDLPYDRPATTMAGFQLCPACHTEYTDPADRRYHAQPTCCPDCGPQLWLEDTASGQRWAGDPIAEAMHRFADGQVLGVKGLGGFHLMCDARNPDAVGLLRERKRRSAKPFAVMAADPTRAASLARLSPAQSALLASPARPIVIAPMAASYDLCPQVAPGLAELGVMLPYTPLHHLLFDDPGLVLVATSGNLSEEPLCHRNSEARQTLGHLADALLLHDRPIHVPVEDSVLLSDAAGQVLPVRRSRGYAPLPLPMPIHGPVVLATGGELKNACGLAVGDQVHLSAHLGQMGSLAAQQAFEASVDQLVRMRRASPRVVATDLHPDYTTSNWAQKYVARHPGTELVCVQHHLAHALALLCEHQVDSGTFIVGALDGTGYGPDQTIWGGEILRVDIDERSVRWQRPSHLPHYPLAGGDRAIRHPWRVALGLARAWQFDISATPAVQAAPPAELRLVESQLSSGLGVVQTSSTGRLFDAAAAITGLCLNAGYEAHPAMLLEQAAARWAGAGTASPVQGAPDHPREAFSTLVGSAGESVEQRAWGFHDQLAAWFAAQLLAQASLAGTTTIGLTGGVLANRLFSRLLTQRLGACGATVLTHQLVPANDGGLALGQAWAARLVADGRLADCAQPSADSG